MARIRTIKPVDAISAASFSGLFMGEGHIDLCRSARGASLCPRLRISLREDDLETLLWVKSLFGGSLGYSSRTRSWCWQLTGRQRVLAAATALAESPIPSKKKNEVRLLLEALALVPDVGRHIHQDASFRLAEIREEMKRARCFYGSH